MSYFSVDIIAKEQLEGVTVGVIVIPPAPGIYVPPVNKGGFLAGRRLTNGILITADGHLLLNINLNKPQYIMID